MLNEGNQIHNFMSSSGSGTVINYGSGYGSDFLTSYGSGYGSGSTSQKVTVPTVPVPVPVPQHWSGYRIKVKIRIRKHIEVKRGSWIRITLMQTRIRITVMRIRTTWLGENNAWCFILCTTPSTPLTLYHPLSNIRLYYICHVQSQMSTSVLRRLFIPALQ